MAALNLQNFISELKREGLAKPNRFHVEILPGKSGSLEIPYPRKYAHVLKGINTSDIPRRIRYFTQNVDTPSRVISAFETPERSFPYGTTYEPVDITFKLSGNAVERKVLDLWQMTIMDPDTELLEYQDYYSRTIRIKMFNNKGEEVYSIDLIDAFPTTSAPLGLDQSSQDESLTITYTFTFRRWKFTEGTSAPSSAELSNAPSSELADSDLTTSSNSDIGAGNTTEVSLDNTIASKQTPIDNKINEIKGSVNFDDDAESQNYFTKLATLKAGNPRAQLTKADGKRFLESMIRDIDNTGNSIVSPSNKSSLTGGAQDMINILS